MPRSRMIKPEFLDDEKLASISRDARLTFIGMWIHSDDYGVVKGHPSWLKNKIFPYEDIRLSDFQKWLTELESLLCIVPFQIDSEKYFYIRTFTKHQTINRPSQQRNPEPPLSILDSLRDDSLNTHGVLTDETETETETETKKTSAPDPSFNSFFDDFWNTYPGRNGKKIGKDQCREYCKRFKNGEREQILTGVKNYASSRQAVEGFAKDPIRFLKHKAWNDWQEPEHDPTDAYDW